LQLHECGLVEHLIPVLVGDFQPAAQRFGNYFADDCHPRALPAVPVAAAEAALAPALAALGLGPVPRHPRRTVASVLTAVVAAHGGGACVEGPLLTSTSAKSPLSDSRRGGPGPAGAEAGAEAGVAGAAAGAGAAGETHALGAAVEMIVAALATAADDADGSAAGNHAPYICRAAVPFVCPLRVPPLDV